MSLQQLAIGVDLFGPPRAESALFLASLGKIRPRQSQQDIDAQKLESVGDLGKGVHGIILL